MTDESVLIIGGGVAGLAAGIYGQLNGYRTCICEMHSLPGGLCTSWKRHGYTIDGCIHWLVGSAPHSGMHRLWQEVGLIEGREFVYADTYLRHEAADGRTVVLYADVERLEQHLLALAPGDAAAIRRLTRAVRRLRGFDPPTDGEPLARRLAKLARLGWLATTHGRQLRRWGTTSIAEYAAQFSDPALREALLEAWVPEFSVLFLLFTFAWLADGNAGYPLGGSLPMARAMERRYADLGGVIHYRHHVRRIHVEGGRAVGVELVDGRQLRASRVVSAADGHATLFDLLGGEYLDDETRQPYEQWPVFAPLLYVGLGLGRTFAEEPHTVSGFTFPLSPPRRIGDAIRHRLPVHLYHHDPSLAPPGATSAVVMLPSQYGYWRDLAADREAYEREKGEVAQAVIAGLEQRFPGISGQVEVVDVATPLTFERYTGNWQGSFEGWLLTPQNAYTVMRPMRQTLAGLAGFYRCGQWVEPGGGLPAAVMSARRLVRLLCREDGRRFQAPIA